MSPLASITSSGWEGRAEIPASQPALRARTSFKASVQGPVHHPSRGSMLPVNAQNDCHAMHHSAAMSACHSNKA